MYIHIWYVMYVWYSVCVYIICNIHMVCNVHIICNLHMISNVHMMCKVYVTCSKKFSEVSFPPSLLWKNDYQTDISECSTARVAAMSTFLCLFPYHYFTTTLLLIYQYFTTTLLPIWLMFESSTARVAATSGPCHAWARVTYRRVIFIYLWYLSLLFCYYYYYCV